MTLYIFVNNNRIDFIQYFRHSHQRKNADNLFLDKISLSDTGIGLKYSFN